MALGNIISYETEKPVPVFVLDLEKALNKRGFIIHNKDHMILKKTYDEHNIRMPEGFDLHMLQLCKPEKSSHILKGDIERVSLLPKFVHVFSKNKKTQVRMLKYQMEDVASLMNDRTFGKAVDESFSSIMGFIEEAL